jgi:hypothetical protein
MNIKIETLLDNFIQSYLSNNNFMLDNTFDSIDCFLRSSTSFQNKNVKVRCFPHALPSFSCYEIFYFNANFALYYRYEFMDVSFVVVGKNTPIGEHIVNKAYGVDDD